MSDQPTKRPALSPERRDTYLKALNELVGTLSINESRPVNIEHFCTVHQIVPTWFDALRDLDGLDKDYVKSVVAGTDWFKAGPKLMQITPEEVLTQLRRMGGQKKAQNQKAEKLDETFPDDSKPEGETIRDQLMREEVAEPQGYKLEPDTTSPLPDFDPSVVRTAQVDGIVKFAVKIDNLDKMQDLCRKALATLSQLEQIVAEFNQTEMKLTIDKSTTSHD